MSNKNLFTGVVIGVVATSAVFYIVYLNNEKNKLRFENNFFRQSFKNKLSNEKIINLNLIPESLRPDFITMVANPHNRIAKVKGTYENSIERIFFLKHIIENRDGYMLFHNNIPSNEDFDNENSCVATNETKNILLKEDQKKVKLNEIKNKLSEKGLHILYDCTWYGVFCDVNKEVNNGRGPVDFKISFGLDQSLIEFKLASNTHLKRNLQNQLDIYAKANGNPNKIFVILYTTEKQELRVNKILTELNLNNQPNVILIDARRDNKISASVA